MISTNRAVADLRAADVHEFEVSAFRLTGASAVVRVVGELDLATVPELESALEGLPPGTRHVLLDLTKLTFLDSTGMAALLTASRRLRSESGSLVLLVDDAQVLRVLQVTGLDRRLAIEDDREAAVRRVTAAALGRGAP